MNSKTSWTYSKSIILCQVGYAPSSTRPLADLLGMSSVLKWKRGGEIRDLCPTPVAVDFSSTRNVSIEIFDDRYPIFRDTLSEHTVLLSGSINWIKTCPDIHGHNNGLSSIDMSMPSFLTENGYLAYAGSISANSDRSPRICLSLCVVNLRRTTDGWMFDATLIKRIPLGLPQTVCEPFLRTGTTADSVQSWAVFSSSHTLENTCVSKFSLFYLNSLHRFCGRRSGPETLWHLRGVSVLQIFALLGGSPVTDHWTPSLWGFMTVGPNLYKSRWRLRTGILEALQIV